MTGMQTEEATETWNKRVNDEKETPKKLIEDYETKKEVQENEKN
jgi:hypothetical protein